MQPSPETESSSPAATKVPRSAPLVEVNRGSITESRHRGHIAAVDGNGTLVASLGDAEAVTYLRSSAKPFQTIPLLVSGAADRFGFTEREVALACASHSGEPVHVELVSSMLKKIGLESSALRCGIHEPYSALEAKRMRELGIPPTVLHNNCSGKHAGMLALALHLGAPIETYEQPDNAVQIAIREVVARFCSCGSEDLAVGIDGCAVPAYGMPISSMASMYARLINPPALDEPTAAACDRIVSAMTRYPELIGGTSDRLDTEMMRATQGRLVSKVGAEGVYTAGIKPCAEWPTGLGLALKIEDGDDYRARPTVVIEALRQLGVLSEDSLSVFARFQVKNRRGDVVGEVRPAFKLQYPS
jgi:L-asparaginase II